MSKSPKGLNLRGCKFNKSMDLLMKKSKINQSDKFSGKRERFKSSLKIEKTNRNKF